MIWGSGGSKSRLAKAAGAEPAGQMRDEKLHAVVARSTFAFSLPSARVSQQATNIFLPEEEDGEMEQSVAQMIVSITQHATEMPQVMHIQEPAATFLFSCPHLHLRC